MITRRFFVASVASALAAPAIVRASSLMPVKLVDWNLPLYGRSPAMDIVHAYRELNDLLYKSLFEMIDREVNPPLFVGEDAIYGGLSFRGVPIRIRTRLPEQSWRPLLK